MIQGTVYVTGVSADTVNTGKLILNIGVTSLNSISYGNLGSSSISNVDPAAPIATTLAALQAQGVAIITNSGVTFGAGDTVVVFSPIW